LLRSEKGFKIFLSELLTMLWLQLPCPPNARILISYCLPTIWKPTIIYNVSQMLMLGFWEGTCCVRKWYSSCCFSLVSSCFFFLLKGKTKDKKNKLINSPPKQSRLFHHLSTGLKHQDDQKKTTDLYRNFITMDRPTRLHQFDDFSILNLEICRNYGDIIALVMTTSLVILLRQLSYLRWKMLLKKSNHDNISTDASRTKCVAVSNMRRCPTLTLPWHPYDTCRAGVINNCFFLSLASTHHRYKSYICFEKCWLIRVYRHYS